MFIVSVVVWKATAMDELRRWNADKKSLNKKKFQKKIWRIDRRSKFGDESMDGGEDEYISVHAAWSPIVYGRYLTG
jgi:hypothetical protein